MAMYLTRFSYTPETWARLIQNPEELLPALQKAKAVRYRQPGA